MCGIAGLVTWAQPTTRIESLDAMLATMVRRGPDHQAHRWLDGAHLGSCRLAIQDLSAGGHQPLLNESGSVAVVFNGEIYNSPGLREQLAANGHRFRGHSDTEVLVHGYEEWGIDGLHERLDGMWAFALWDSQRRVLYLSRDRCGEKPLFYTRRGSELWFASTIDALLAGLRGTPAVDAGAIAEYLSLGYVPSDVSAFAGVGKLPPACYAVATDSSLTCHRYWRMPYREGSDDLGKLEESLEEVLDRAVKQCLLSDVPIGAFLSGGIDSSLIVALMARRQRAPRTFTMRVPGTACDEGDYARQVADHCGTEHVEIVLDSTCVEALPELVAQLGEPYSDSSCIPAYFVSRAIREHATVVLGGDGGDEAFGGYRTVPWLVRLEQLHQAGASGLRWAGPALLRWTDGHPDHRRPLSRRLRGAAYASDFQLYLRSLCQLSPDQVQQLAGPALRDSGAEWQRPYLMAQDGLSSAPWFQRGLAAGHTKLAGDFLVKVDTATMGHSVEARSPFLGRDVLEFAAGLPAAAIADRAVDKVLLRRLARRLVPKVCIDRPKRGFSVPLREWVEGPWRPLIDGLLNDSLAVSEGLLAWEGVQLLLRRAPAFQRGWSTTVFIVLMLELWLRIVVKRTDSVASLREAITPAAATR